MRVTLEFDKGDVQARALLRALRAETTVRRKPLGRGLAPGDLPHLVFDGLEWVVRRTVCAVIK